MRGVSRSCVLPLQAKILGLQEQVAEAKAEAATWRKRDEEQRSQLAAHDGCDARLAAAKTTATDCKARLADAIADATDSRRAHERCSETLTRALAQRDAAQRQLDVARGQLRELEAAKEQLKSAAEGMRRAAQTEAAALRASQGDVSRADAAEHRVHELEEAGAAAEARATAAQQDAALVPGLREALLRAEAVRGGRAVFESDTGRVCLQRANTGKCLHRRWRKRKGRNDLSLRNGCVRCKSSPCRAMSTAPRSPTSSSASQQRYRRPLTMSRALLGRAMNLSSCASR